jgi:hypothetical protein
MAYNARRLITEAYNLTNIVSREYQTIDGDQLSLGLSLLNDFLAFESIQTQNIPYYQEYTFDTIVGQEKYFVPFLVDIESICFFLSNIRIPMSKKSRKEYFYTGRLEGLTIMPFTCRLERCFGGANLWIYPLSNIPYTITAMVKYGLEEVTSYEDDLSLVYDRFYLLYMRYALAELICNAEGISIPPNVTDKLNNIRDELIETSPPDMTCTSISTLGVSGCPDMVSQVVETWILGGWIP